VHTGKIILSITKTFSNKYAINDLFCHVTTGADFVKRQALMCHRVLRTIESVAKESAMLTRDTWETLLKFLLAANDSLLSPPTEKGKILTVKDTQ
jgi:hypothetical protein